MAQLIYTTQNGETVPIQLPAATEFTAKVVWFAPPTKDVETKLRQDLAQAAIPELARAGDHIVYGVPEVCLIAIIQMQELAGEARLAGAGMLVHRSRHKWMIVADGDAQLYVDKARIPLMKIVKEGMQIQLGGLDMVFRDVERKRVDVDIMKMIHRKSCPFCRDPFQIGEEIIACPACGMVQHAECWDEYKGRCSGPPGCPYGVKADRLLEK